MYPTSESAIIVQECRQKQFCILQKLEVALLENREVQHSKVVKEIVQFYGDAFNHKDHLEAQLIQLHSGNEQALYDVLTVIAYQQSLSTTERNYYCEVIKLVKLILVIPATNAVSEWSFSALCGIKTWLRSTTGPVRLNWSMILHIHKEGMGTLPVLSLANNFFLT